MGAGTYALLWDQERQREFQVEDAHTLYLEMLGELGVVGLLLILVVVGVVLIGLLLRVRGPSRGVAAGLLGAALTWVLHAGIDWDWEMPAVTVWFFAIGGLAVARRVTGGGEDGDDPRPARTSAQGPPRLVRLLAALGCLLLAVVPARIALSAARWRTAPRPSRKVTALRRSIGRSTPQGRSPCGPSRSPFSATAMCDWVSLLTGRLSELAVAARRGGASPALAGNDTASHLMHSATRARGQDGAGEDGRRRRPREPSHLPAKRSQPGRGGAKMTAHIGRSLLEVVCVRGDVVDQPIA